MTTKCTPKFRHHKASGQGFVELGGKRIYLGRYDLPETRERYHRMIAEWEAAGQQTSVARDELTIDELPHLHQPECQPRPPRLQVGRGRRPGACPCLTRTPGRRWAQAWAV